MLIYYNGANCTGTVRWLNDGGGIGDLQYCKYIVPEIKTGNLFVAQDNGPSTTDGVAVSVAFTSVSIWNYGSCSADTSNTGWPLVAISRTTAGIPTTIVGPIAIR